jgi:hypothetical protein
MRALHLMCVCVCCVSLQVTKWLVEHAGADVHARDEVCITYCYAYACNYQSRDLRNHIDCHCL